MQRLAALESELSISLSVLPARLASVIIVTIDLNPPVKGQSSVYIS